jgi:transposase
MEIVHRLCCGLDVHKRSVVACLRLVGPDGQVRKEKRTFGTTTRQLLALSDWLTGAGCTHVAMESTGVYWKPVFNVLEGQFEEVLVVNAQHIKAVPGRKTDMADAEWICDLLAHGLLRGSFIPSAGQRQLRDLTRYRTTLVRERARVINRVQKLLEGANIKLASVVTDITGMSARAMLNALVAGQTDPAELAKLGHPRLKATPEELAEALEGAVKPHERFMLREQLAHMDYLEGVIGRVSREIEAALRPFEAELALLMSIPGISRIVAEVLLAEIGADMSRFATSGHLASWAGMCPGHNESAGKRKSGTTRKGSPWLRAALVEAAHGASHKKDCYLQSQYRRLAARRGRKKALIAVGHSILEIAYRVLSDRVPYAELGANYFEERNREATQKRLIRRLENLGLEVTVKPLPTASPAADALAA